MIAFLKEELRDMRTGAKEQQLRVDEIFERQFGLIEHYSGSAYLKPRQNDNEEEKKRDLRPINRDRSIASRIARAEAKENDPVLKAKRDNEYHDRIAKLMNPEIEIEGNNA